ncbi:MAG: glycerol-3-phosphate acyltransferase [Bacillus subtilis]|nr:glycerol-3-phosphate acyltransferase [Bacillus subtilis]
MMPMKGGDRPWLTSLIVIAYLLGSIPFSLILGLALPSTRTSASSAAAISAPRTPFASSENRSASRVLLRRYAEERPDRLPDPEHGAVRRRHSSSIRSSTASHAVVGHCFPVWLKFKGGKGVASSFGLLLAYNPWIALDAPRGLPVDGVPDALRLRLLDDRRVVRRRARHRLAFPLASRTSAS